MEEMEIGSEEKCDKSLDDRSSDEENESKARAENEIEADSDDESVDSKDEDDEDDEDADEAEVKILEAALNQNPYDYANHVALINKLQRMGELIRLRAARENMSSKYPLSPELWLSWMRDEIKLATTVEQKSEVAKLCERAVKDYLCKFHFYEQNVHFAQKYSVVVKRAAGNCSDKLMNSTQLLKKHCNWFLHYVFEKFFTSHFILLDVLYIGGYIDFIQFSHKRSMHSDRFRSLFLHQSRFKIFVSTKPYHVN